MNNEKTQNEDKLILFQFPSAVMPNRIPQVSKYHFSTSISSKFQRFDALNLFRQEIEESRAGVHHQLYTMQKRQVFAYRIVYFAFFLLFNGLAMASTQLPSIVNGGLLLGTHTFLKGGIMATCILLAIASFSLCLALHPRREAVNQTVRHAKERFKTLLMRRQLKMGIKRSFLFGLRRRNASTLTQMYREGIEKINEFKDETIHLTQRIATAETLDKKEKERLLNQAIEELDENLRLIIHSFRHAPVPE